MLEVFLNILHNAITLIFGVYISSIFLGVEMNRKNSLILFDFTSLIGVSYALSFIYFGEEITTQIYPLIIHIPLIFFLTIYYKYKFSLSILSVLIAYLCCQISKWVGLVFLDLSQLYWVYYSIRIMITVFVFIVLIRYLSDTTLQLFQMPDSSPFIFIMIPFTYYIFDYVTGVYTSLIYSGKEVVVEFLGFILCISYLLFLFVYFKQYQEKQEAKQRNHIMEMQRNQSQKELEAIKRCEYSISLLRHDMRHFLANISTFIDQNEMEKAKDYISEIINTVEKSTIHKYCKNEFVNMILSSHENSIKENQIDFTYSIQIPEVLPFSDVDLTSILSNAFENAIQSVLPLKEEQRKIILNMKMNEDKLLISLKNTYDEVPEIIDGMPVHSKEGHGFGTKSIRYISEKMNGNCQFMVKEEWFILRIVI